MRSMTANRGAPSVGQAGPGGFWEMAAAIGFGVVAAGIAKFVPAFLGPVMGLSLVAGGCLVVVATKFDVRSIAASFLILAAFMVPMNRVRIGPAAISDFAIVAAAGLYVLVRLVERRKVEDHTYRPIMIGLATIALGGLIGAIFEAPGVFLYKALAVATRDISGWGPNLANFAKFLAGAFLPMTLWWLARPSRQLMRYVLTAFVAGASVSALAGVVLPSARAAGRSYGMTVHPGQLGSLSVLGMAAALALLLSRRPFRPWFAAVLPLLALGVLTSGSRAALGAFVALALILGPLTSNKLVMGFVMTGAAVVLALIVAGGIKPEGTNAIGRALGSDPHAENSSEIRDDLGDRVYAKWVQRPITGNGFNYMKPSHNVYLGLLASAGVLGIVGLGLVVTTILRRTWRRRSDLLVAGMSAGYVAYLAAAYYDNIFWERWLWFTVGMVVAVGATRPLPGEVGYEAWVAELEAEAEPGVAVSTR